ncbi:hypothetical protein AeMF1_003839 [Aphanomyces euteiches]|nr:hypothetical protein AeMF1_003839 [Aphanomyces euteiches]KAH9187488.1 hypothetical protein AeNC1_010533 [Aphanomyces euteiches]
MNAPVFLQKTYDMLECCPSEVAEWSKDGRSFVVKQTKQFETSMLPQFFKHNNFASFARQLRFYGFEKSKIHEARFGDVSETGQSWWLFQHPKFLRDDPAKMVSIRRKTCTEAVTTKWEAGEVNELKHRLESLQSTMSSLSSKISALTAAVHTYAAEEMDLLPASKKLKTSPKIEENVTFSPKTVEDGPSLDYGWNFNLDEAFPDVDEHLFASLLDMELPLVC